MVRDRFFALCLASPLLLFSGCLGRVSAPGIEPAPVLTPDAGSNPTSGWEDRCAALESTYAAPEIPGPALRSFYVDAQAGDDANDGLSTAAAWRTLTKANATVRAGDWVYLSGDFVNQQIAPATSGSADARIVYRPLSGAAPTLTNDPGSSLSTLQFVGRSYVVVEGIAVRQQGTGNGLYLYDASFIWIRGVTLEGGQNRIFSSSDNRIEDSVLQRPSDVQRDFWMRDGLERNVFARNRLSGAYVYVGMGDLSVRPSVDNVFFANSFENPNGAAIGLSGLVERTLFLCNTVHDVGADQSLTLQNGNPAAPEGGSPAMLLSSSRNVVRYNRFLNNRWEIIRVQARGDCTNPAGLMNADENLIQHNVFVGNGGPHLRILNSGPGPSGCGGAEPLWGDSRGNRVENNVYWNNATVCDFHYCDVATGRVYAFVVDLYHSEQSGWPTGAAGMNGNIFRNNLAGRSADAAGEEWLRWIAYRAADARTETLSEAEAAFPGELDQNSEVDPELSDIDAGDLTPVETSPVIDFGVTIDGLTYRGAAPEAGRFERTP